MIGAISPWLYTVTLLGALFLGLCKRRNELLLLDRERPASAKSLKMYTPSLLDSLTSVAASSTIWRIRCTRSRRPSCPTTT